jgi:hypothetical protein
MLRTFAGCGARRHNRSTRVGAPDFPPEQKQRAVAKLKRHGFDVESDSLPPVSLLGTHGSASSAQRSPPRPPAPRMVLVGRAGNIIPPVRRA